MILDRLNNHSLYDAVHRLFPAAFHFIETCDPAPEPGRYELSDGMYAMVQAYQTRPVEDALYEAHRNFIDIQYIVEGSEQIYYAQVSDLQAEEFQPEKDYLPLKGSGQPLLIQSGEFAVFFPQDAHLPSRMIDKPAPVKKIVVKVPVIAS